MSNPRNFSLLLFENFLSICIVKWILQDCQFIRIIFAYGKIDCTSRRNYVSEARSVQRIVSKMSSELHGLEMIYGNDAANTIFTQLLIN